MTNLFSQSIRSAAITGAGGGLGREIALALYDLMINRKKSEEAAARFVSPAYIQHNPLIADGSEAFGKIFWPSDARARQPPRHRPPHYRGR
jgi:predicted SnoaL-like aldol condensation-catalyzing enzyme